jgi:tRNA(Arg) A34 adenosine deaminase TadA
MCAYAIRLARIAMVVSGAAGGDGEQALSGRMVLADPAILPGRAEPLVVRDVLGAECRAVQSSEP